MTIALFSTIVFGLIAVLLSWELDKLKKSNLKERKLEEDRIYKLSVLKQVEEEISYTTDAEKVINIIMASLKNFFNYSMAGSMVIKDANVIFKAYAEEQVSNQYVDQVEEKMISSLSKLLGRKPEKIDRTIHGIALSNTGPTTYSSSFHIPLIVNNKVLALIHLSSTAENVLNDMEDLHELIDTATTALTGFSQAIDAQTYKLTSLISSVEDGILMADNKNNLLFINDSAKKILGLTGENTTFLDVASAFDQNLNLTAKINEVIAQKDPFVEREIQISNAKIVDIFVSPIAQGKASIVLHDMSEYKKKEVSKEDLTNIMVHELRAPITTIKDSAELIISTKDLEEEKKLKFLEIIHQQAKKILGQVGSILDTAKLDAGKLVLQKTKGDISKLIKSEMESFMPQAERKNISLSFNSLNKPIPEIFFDPIRITQVIDNLLSNSIKFTPINGTIKVEIDYKTIPPVLDGLSPMENILSLDKYIVVSVSDTGVGIDKEQQKRLFSKYIQAKNSPNEVSKLGTGLGLYLIKGIMESHEGRVWVKSAPGEGTTFSFSLPATDDNKTAYDAPKPSTPSASPLSKLSRTVN